MVGLLKAITDFLNHYWTTILGSVPESVNNGNGDTYDMDPALSFVMHFGSTQKHSQDLKNLSRILDIARPC